MAYKGVAAVPSFLIGTIRFRDSLGRIIDDLEGSPGIKVLRL